MGASMGRRSRRVQAQVALTGRPAFAQQPTRVSGRWPLLLCALVLLAAACAAPGAASPAPLAASPPEPRIDLRPLVKTGFSPSGLQVILATGDLGVGPNRVGFSLVTRKALVTAPEAHVGAYPSDGVAPVEPREQAVAAFQPWPYDARGLYTTQLTFDRPGTWSMDVSVTQDGGATLAATVIFDVLEATEAPAVGAPAPRSHSKTVSGVQALEELSTGSMIDPDLYQVTIADAAGSALPTVVVFASPAFCANEVCGPQVEVLQQIKDAYRGQANFIHVDLYENPHEIQGDIDRSRISPVVEEWGLPSIEWTFVLDRHGNVAAKFEAFATLTEVQAALEAVL